MSAWHGRGSVNVVGVVKASLNTDWCYGPLHWKAVIYHYLHWEEARAFLEKGRGEGAVNNKIHNIHLSVGAHCEAGYIDMHLKHLRWLSMVCGKWNWS